ncbi:hypothetical protein PbB2_00200 [Candidatus Phycosocius bacilliformis]|uniref:Uncharacterized protein n=1 Tax=Candidatus Phycosocius bacilliformis TaxID=1445552 RepID=A0A2P2E649_9PROT|nr:hypothetical protein [Candidatus Phycosocius bacilliformis]GBF56543.1 hypothetical protein PbB2_00200 [Candidatus Phycosocius bacilliformis]
MKNFITSFIGFSLASLIYYLVVSGPLDGRQLAIILSGGFVFAVWFEGLSLFFRRLFLWLGRYYAKRQEEV